MTFTTTTMMIASLSRLGRRPVQPAVNPAGWGAREGGPRNEFPLGAPVAEAAMVLPLLILRVMLTMMTAVMLKMIILLTIMDGRRRRTF
jgi:hypothetical protein